MSTKAATLPMEPIVEVEMTPKPALPAVVSERPADEFVAMLERLATNPATNVEVFERLMALREKGEAKTAEAIFHGAMADAQAEMRPVAKDADNPQTRSRYASYEQLDRAVRPIYTKHGFGLSFDTGDCSIQDWIRVLCVVTHRSGHARTFKLDMPADGKGAKGGDVMTKTHAVASAMSYGMRNMLKMIFNIAIGEGDDDGNKAGGHVPADAPKGYEAFMADLRASAAKGNATFYAFWNKADEALRRHLTRHAPNEWQALKKQAAEVKA